MPVQGIEFGGTYSAYNTSSNAYVAGDAANQTITLVIGKSDGTFTEVSPASPPVDQGNGSYGIVLTAAQTAAPTVSITITGRSTTANVVVIPTGPIPFQPALSFLPTPVPVPTPTPTPAGTCPFEIDLSLIGASSATIQGITGMPNGATPTGATIPGMMYGPNGGVFSYQFTDVTTPAPSQYLFFGTCVGGPGYFSGVLNVFTPVGYYTSMKAAEKKVGIYEIAISSNKDNTVATYPNGAPVPDLTQIQDALTQTDNDINALALTYNRVTPIPKTINLWGYLSDMAAWNVAILLGEARGLAQAAGTLGAQLADKKRELWGDGTVRCMGRFQKFFKNVQAIYDIPRAYPQTQAPLVVLSPVIAPYGSSGNVILPSSTIPTVPQS